MMPVLHFRKSQILSSTQLLMSKGAKVRISMLMLHLTEIQGKKGDIEVVFSARPNTQYAIAIVEVEKDNVDKDVDVVVLW